MAAELPDGRRALQRDVFTSVGKAARDLALGPRTLRRAIATGELPAYTFGARAKVRITDVRAWVEAHCRRP